MNEKVAVEAAAAQHRPWYSELTRYHWWVLIVATLGWLFDTMDMRIFVLSRGPAIAELLGPGATDVEIKWYSGIATAVFMIGWAMGGFIFGIVGDRWGRAKTMMLTVLIYSIFTGWSGLAVSWWDFMIYRFLTGLGVGGEFAAGVALVAEVMPDRARPHALGLLQAFSTFGNLTGSAISFVVLPLGWRWMFAVGVLPALLVVIIRRRLKEPEAWQRAKRSADQMLERQLGDIRELFQDRRWRYNTFIGVTLALSGVVGLWGIGFWTPELIREALAQSPSTERAWYVSMGMLLQDVGSFFGIYAFSLITARIGRRPTFALFFLLGLAATVLTFGWLDTKSDIFWMIPLLGFCNLSVFGGYSIYFPELYPTRLRSTGTGFCYNVGRVIAAIGPFTLGYLTVAFADAGFDSPFRAAAISLAMIYLLGVLIIPFAPETKGKPLPED